MPLTPALAEALAQVARSAASAPHGSKGPIYSDAARTLGISTKTLMRYLAKLTVRPARRRRRDAGSSSLTLDEAQRISALLMESHRKTGKRLMSVGHALALLRANGEVRAMRLDKRTGQPVPLCPTAVSRALRAYTLHPDQLMQPRPAVELKSLHPNHVWQIDASLCVLYYLQDAPAESAGLRVMEAKVFNKNKPANLKRIESQRVWRYVVTDHYSGTLFVHYVLGAESGLNLAESFIAAMQQRDGDPFHGVPFVLMMDMGSANTSGLFTNLLRRLRVLPLPHAPENARATGQVENAQNLVECGFESTLRLQPVHSLAELNASASQWARSFNANQVHRRHGRTRYAMWLTIGQAELRIAPPPDVCRELMTHAPERRKVTERLRVSFRGPEFDVSRVPGVHVGAWLQVTLNPYATDSACVVDVDANGEEMLHVVPLVRKDEAGFAEGANVIGVDYRRPADTAADASRRVVELRAMDATSLAEAAARRKAGALPFGGRLVPAKVAEQAPPQHFIGKRGTALTPAAKVTAAQPMVHELSLFQAASELARRGVPMDPERNAQVQAWYPAGRVPEAELDELERRLQARFALRVMPGANRA